MTLKIVGNITVPKLTELGFKYNGLANSYDFELTEKEYLSVSSYDHSLTFRASMKTVHDYGLAVLMDLIQGGYVEK